MNTLFPSQIFQPRSQEVTVASIATKAMEVSVVRGNCTLTLNDSTPSQSVIAEAGDSITLTFTTKSGYTETDTFEFLVDGKKSYFMYCTEDSQETFFDNYYVGKSFLDNVTGTDGSSVSYTSDNSLLFISNDGKETILDLKNLEPNREKSENISLYLDNRSSKLYSIDVDNRFVIKEVNLGSAALGTAIAKRPGNGSEKITWVTLQDGRVVGLDKDYKIVESLAISGRATGIDTSTDGRLVAISDTAANKVIIHEYLGDQWRMSVMSGIGYPYDIFVDVKKNIWVTNKIGNQLQVFPFGSRIPIVLIVGQGQKTIKQVNDRTLGIVCTESNEIVMIDTRTKAIVNRLPAKLPIDMAVYGKTMYIANVYNEIYQINRARTNDLTGEFVLYKSGVNSVYAMETLKDGTLVVAKMYSNTPQMVRTPSYSVDQFFVDLPPFVSSKSVYESGPIKISGPERPIPLAFPDGIGTVSVTRKNEFEDAPIQQFSQMATNASSTITDGSVLSFTITLPEDYKNGEEISFPILAGNNLTYFQSVAKVEAIRVKPFKINNNLPVDLSVPYKSNEVVIEGLGDGNFTTIDFTKDGGGAIDLYVNGEKIESGSTTVSDGDVVYFYGELTEEDFEDTKDYIGFDSLNLQVQVGDYVGNWQILHVENPSGEVVTKPYTEKLPMQSLNWNLGTWDEVSVFDSNLDLETTIRLGEDYQTFNPVFEEDELLLVDYFSRKVFQIDTSDHSLSRQSTKFDFGPYAATRSNNSIFVTFPDEMVIRELDGQSLLPIRTISLGYNPYGIVKFKNQIYVAGFDGKVHIYDENFNPVSTIQVSGNLTDLRLVGEQLYVTDITNSKIKIVENRNVVGVREAGGNPYNFAFADDGSMLIANNFDNTITLFDNLGSSQTIELGRPIHDVAWFAGEWRIIDMQTSSIVGNFNTENVEQPSEYSKPTLKQNTYLIPFGEKLYVAHLTSNFSTILEPREWVNTNDSFIPQKDVNIHLPLRSNDITLNYMSRSQVLSVPADSGYSLIHNGVKTGSSALVNTGDTIAILIEDLQYYDQSQEILITGMNTVLSFEFETQPNYLPKYIKFNPVFGMLPGEWANSNSRRISGISDDNFAISVSISDKDVGVYVNNILVKEPGSKAIFKLKNGDVIRLIWETELDDNLAKTVTLYCDQANALFATWNVYKLPLLGVGDLGVWFAWSMLRCDRLTPEVSEKIKQLSFEREGVEIIGRKFVDLVKQVSHINPALTQIAKDFGSPAICEMYNISPVVLYGIINSNPVAFLQDREAQVVNDSVYCKDKKVLVSGSAKKFMQSVFADYIYKSKTFMGSLSPLFVQEDEKFEIEKAPPILSLQKQFLQEKKSVNAYSVQTFAFAREALMSEYSRLFSIDREHINNTTFDIFVKAVYDQIFNDNKVFVDADYRKQEFTMLLPDAIYAKYNFNDLYQNSYYYHPDHFDIFVDANYYHPDHFDIFVDANYYQIDHFDIFVDAIYYQIDHFDIFVDANYFYEHDKNLILNSEYSFNSIDNQSFEAEAQLRLLNSLKIVKTKILEEFYYSTKYGELKYAVNFENVVFGNVTYTSFMDRSALFFNIEYKNGNENTHIESFRFNYDTSNYNEIQFIRPIWGFAKIPAVFRKNLHFPESLTQIQLANVMNQENLSPAERGSFTEDGLQFFIDVNDQFEEGFLQKFQLPDGSWMYYHVNRLKYGECVLHKYIVEMGIARGG